MGLEAGQHLASEMRPVRGRVGATPSLERNCLNDAMLREPRVYEMKGPGLAITYRRSDGELDGQVDDSSYEKLEADLTRTSEIGMLVNAVLLPSSRNETRITLTLLLPEVRWRLTRALSERAEITGVAIVADIYTDLVDGPPPTLQKYEARPLEGTAIG